MVSIVTSNVPLSIIIILLQRRKIPSTGTTEKYATSGQE